MRKMRLLISLSRVISISHLRVSSQNHAQTGNKDNNNLYNKLKRLFGFETFKGDLLCFRWPVGVVANPNPFSLSLNESKISINCSLYT